MIFYVSIFFAEIQSSDLTSCFNYTQESFYYLQTLSIVGCSSLTNLTSSTLLATSSYLTYLKLSECSLQHIEAISLSSSGSNIRHLDFAHNKISHIPLEFFSTLTHLKTLNLSGNRFTKFDISVVRYLSEVIIDDSFYLKSLEFSDQVITDLENLSAKNNRRLRQICPWILWSSPKLKNVDLSRCPQLELPHRVFKSNNNLQEKIKIDQVACDCSPPPLDIVKTCYFNGSHVNTETFRYKNCYISPDGNQDDVKDVTVFQKVLMDCSSDNADQFNHFLWITPLGTVSYTHLTLPTIYSV